MRLGHYPRIEPAEAKELLDVEYLESTPRNLSQYNLIYEGVRPSTFTGLGLKLLVEAIKMSVISGQEGRIGLHSLPLTDGIYRNIDGLIELEKDPHCLAFGRYR